MISLSPINYYARRPSRPSSNRWWSALLILSIPVLILAGLRPILGGSQWVQVVELVFIDLVLSLDNLLVILIVIGRLAAKSQKRRVLIVGLSLALLMRAALTLVSQELLRYSWLAVVGGILLLAIANRLWPEDAPGGSTGRRKKSLTPSGAVFLIVMVDLLASFDNAMSNAGIARNKMWLGLGALALSMLVLLCLLVANTLGRAEVSVFEKWLLRWRRERIQLRLVLIGLRQPPPRRHSYTPAAIKRQRTARIASRRGEAGASRQLRQRPLYGADPLVSKVLRRGRAPRTKRYLADAVISSRLQRLERWEKALELFQQVVRLGVYGGAVAVLSWAGGGLILSRASLPPGVELVFHLLIAGGTVAWHWLGPWLGERIPQGWRRRFERLNELRKEKIGQPLARRTESLLAHWPWGQRLWRELATLSDRAVRR